MAPGTTRAGLAKHDSPSLLEGATVTDKRLVVSTNRRPTAGSGRRPRLALACAVSLGCHLAGVTLLAGWVPPARAVATLDGAISVYPKAEADPAGPIESAPPAAPLAGNARPPRKIPRPPRARLPPMRQARVTKTPSPPAPPPPAPVALTSAKDGRGASVEAAPARPAQPVHITSGVARALRIHDVFPRMPELLRLQQRTETVDAEICVSEQGSVSAVRLRGGSATLEKVLREAMLQWRYRPLLLQGTARSFCHGVHLVYRP
jgi:hypothetical protein